MINVLNLITLSALDHLLILGTLSNDDEDGRENITKNMNLGIFKLYRVTLLGNKCRRLLQELNP